VSVCERDRERVCVYVRVRVLFVVVVVVVVVLCTVCFVSCGDCWARPASAACGV
jgi:hypothetical protein